ncbi:MAG TPA: FAD/NAD(P)-binding protein [Chloroflexia bacterium]|nr:FAD/NAD(P)-binding protein [Chloroflexia bacterium]
MIDTIIPAAVESAALPMLPQPYRIIRVRQETADTRTLDIEPVDGSRCPRFIPGQFNMLYIFGVGEMAISISGDPAWRSTTTHTIRAVGNATRALTSLKPGDTIGVRGPFGVGWPVEQMAGKDVLVIAGGIGLAPLRPTIYTALNNRRAYESVSLLYGARTPIDLLYTDELEQWRSRHDMYVGVTVDSAGDNWGGNVGVVTTLIPKAHFDEKKTIAMVCGPEIMMRFTVMALQDRGVPLENIYISMERNMKCGIGLCGHCQLGPDFICKDGPVFRFDHLESVFGKREV